ncbi:MAG: response regulator receiver modulated CheB methylesterase [Rhodospirillales bacterium]|nr:response regulator receiver modulated CheB methylesterase [Rhodospirillales bacterium]
MNATTEHGREVRVLVVDDSALMRQLIAEALSSDSSLRVVGTAADAFIARRKIKDLAPDVITLDVEMPDMNGLDFLRKIMTLRPMPVIMVSTLTRRGAETTLEALALGAVDVVAKPSQISRDSVAVPDIARFRGELVDKVKAAATAQLAARGQRTTSPSAAVPRSGPPTSGIVAIGASTGGVQALKDIIVELPRHCPPIIVTQHMPEYFTATFAARLDRECTVSVVEAKDGMAIVPGQVCIAEGDHHLELARSGNRYVCRLSEGPLVSGHRPSVDVLFRSVAEVVGPDALGIILTGMGRDGAAGLGAMRAAGARTIGQNEASCVVYGMPKAARESGAVEVEMALDHIAGEIMSGRRSRRAATG